MSQAMKSVKRSNANKQHINLRPWRFLLMTRTALKIRGFFLAARIRWVMRRLFPVAMMESILLGIIGIPARAATTDARMSLTNLARDEFPAACSVQRGGCDGKSLALEHTAGIGRRQTPLANAGCVFVYFPITGLWLGDIL